MIALTLNIIISIIAARSGTWIMETWTETKFKKRVIGTVKLWDVVYVAFLEGVSSFSAVSVVKLKH